MSLWIEKTRETFILISYQHSMHKKSPIEGDRVYIVKYQPGSQIFASTRYVYHNTTCLMILYTFTETTYVRYLKVVANYIRHYNHLAACVIEDMHSKVYIPRTRKKYKIEEYRIWFSNMFITEVDTSKHCISLHNET